MICSHSSQCARYVKEVSRCRLMKNKFSLAPLTLPFQCRDHVPVLCLALRRDGVGRTEVWRFDGVHSGTDSSLITHKREMSTLQPTKQRSNVTGPNSNVVTVSVFGNFI